MIMLLHEARVEIIPITVDIYMWNYEGQPRIFVLPKHFPRYVIDKMDTSLLQVESFFWRAVKEFDE